MTYASLLHQSLESGVGALFAEQPPNLLDVIGQEFVSEVQGEGLAEIELAFVRDLKELVTVADVVGQGVEIVDELGTAINVAGPFAQKRFVLVSAARGHEFEGFLQVFIADTQGFLV